MQILYTGASIYQALQNDPNLSLGGLISSSPVPNNMLNAMFGDLSWQGVQNKRVETKAFVLQNTTGFDATDVVVGYQYPANVGAQFKLEIAFVSLTVPSNGMEHIPNSGATPLFATFAEANINPSVPVDNSIDIGALANTAMIGFWLRLSILSGLTPPNFATVDDQINWWQNISDPDYNILQTIQLKIKYTYNQP